MRRANDIAADLEERAAAGSKSARSKITLLRLCVAVGGSYCPQLPELIDNGRGMALMRQPLVFEAGAGVFTITELGRSVVSALRPVVA